MASVFLIVYTIPNMTQYSVTSMMKKLDLGSIRSSPACWHFGKISTILGDSEGGVKVELHKGV